MFFGFRILPYMNVILYSSVYQVRQGLHLTHVTFSPNGEEILLSYSGEHVYLMDVNPGIFLTPLLFVNALLLVAVS